MISLDNFDLQIVAANSNEKLEWSLCTDTF